MSRCNGCAKRVEPAWEQTAEFKMSKYCAVCLWGEAFYLQ